MECPNCGNTSFNICIDIKDCKDLMDLRITLQELPDDFANEKTALRCTKCNHSFQGIDFIHNKR